MMRRVEVLFIVKPTTDCFDYFYGIESATLPRRRSFRWIIRMIACEWGRSILRSFYSSRFYLREQLRNWQAFCPILKATALKCCCPTVTISEVTIDWTEKFYETGGKGRFSQKLVAFYRTHLKNRSFAGNFDAKRFICGGGRMRGTEGVGVAALAAYTRSGHTIL